MMAAIMGRTSSNNQKDTAAAADVNIAELSANSVLDLFESVYKSLEHRECAIKCLERCDEIWSDEEENGLPHSRALLVAGCAMDVAGTEDMGASKSARQMFVFGCMLVSTVLGAVSAEESEGGHPTLAADLLDAIEAGSGQTLARLVGCGLECLNQQTNLSVDVFLPVLRSVEELVRSLVRWQLTLSRADALLASGAITAALSTAASHPSSAAVYRILASILTALAGPNPESELCDALVALGVLPAIIHAIRTFATDSGEESLVELMMGLLDALTQSDNGRSEARTNGAAGAIDVLLASRPGQGDTDWQREAKVLRAVIASEDLAGVLSELNLPPDALEAASADADLSGRDPGPKAAAMAQPVGVAPIAHVYGLDGDTAWYWY